MTTEAPRTTSATKVASEETRKASRTYRGDPCVRCGSTERYRRMNRCAACDRAHSRRQREAKGVHTTGGIDLAARTCVPGCDKPIGHLPAQELFCSDACRQRTIARVMAPLYARIAARRRVLRIPFQEVVQ